MTRTLLLTLLLPLLSAAPVRPAAAQEPERILLESGDVVEGRLLADDGSRIVIRRTVDGGTVEATYAYADLDPRTVYRLHLGRADGEDPGDQLALAQYAMEHGLLDRARRHLARAGRLEPSLGPRVEAGMKRLDSLTAARLVERAQGALDDDRVLDAERLLARAVETAPDAPEAEVARRLLRKIEPRVAEERARRLERRMPDADADGALAAARTHYAHGHTALRRGLQSTGSQRRAVDAFEQAIREFEAARARIDGVAAARPEDAGQRSRLRTVRGLVSGDLHEARLHLASLYFTRSSLQDALGLVNRVLAEDRRHPEARAMRARLETAINADDWPGGREAARRARRAR